MSFACSAEIGHGRPVPVAMSCPCTVSSDSARAVRQSTVRVRPEPYHGVSHSICGSAAATSFRNCCAPAVISSASRLASVWSTMALVAALEAASRVGKSASRYCSGVSACGSPAIAALNPVNTTDTWAAVSATVQSVPAAGRPMSSVSRSSAVNRPAAALIAARTACRSSVTTAGVSSLLHCRGRWSGWCGWSWWSPRVGTSRLSDVVGAGSSVLTRRSVRRGVVAPHGGAANLRVSADVCGTWSPHAG